MLKKIFIYSSFFQAMIDICAEKGWLITVIRIQQLMQCVVQGRWYDDSPVLSLPHVEEYNIPCFNKIPVMYVKTHFLNIFIPYLISIDYFIQSYDMFL